MSSRSLPGSLRRAPRAPQDGRPQEPPRAPQDGPKSRQERPKSRPGAISERPWRDQPCSQEPPGDLQEAMWDPSVIDFTTSGVWDPSELDFTPSGGRFWRAQALHPEVCGGTFEQLLALTNLFSYHPRGLPKGSARRTKLTPGASPEYGQKTIKPKSNKLLQHA